MKEKILAYWQDKYERIQWELRDNEGKLENVIKRQKDLPVAILRPVMAAFVIFSLIFCLWCFQDNIMVMFYPFYCAAILGLSVVTVIYNGCRFIKAIRQYIWHTRQWGEVIYPKPERVRSNYSLHVPLNYYAERKCIEWLLQQYTDNNVKMMELKRKIDDTPEEDLDPLWEELESIMIYERVKRARE